MRNLFFAKDGKATIKPIIIEKKIEITEIYIVVLNPLIKNLRLVRPLMFFGFIMYHPQSKLEVQPFKNRNKAKYFRIFTFVKRLILNIINFLDYIFLVIYQKNRKFSSFQSNDLHS